MDGGSLEGDPLVEVLVEEEKASPQEDTSGSQAPYAMIVAGGAVGAMLVLGIAYGISRTATMQRLMANPHPRAATAEAVVREMLHIDLPAIPNIGPSSPSRLAQSPGRSSRDKLSKMFGRVFRGPDGGHHRQDLAAMDVDVVAAMPSTGEQCEAGSLSSDLLDPEPPQLRPNLKKALSIRLSTTLPTSRLAGVLAQAGMSPSQSSSRNEDEVHCGEDDEAPTLALTEMGVDRSMARNAGKDLDLGQLAPLSDLAPSSSYLESSSAEYGGNDCEELEHPVDPGELWPRVSHKEEDLADGVTCGGSVVSAVDNDAMRRDARVKDDEKITNTASLTSSDIQSEHHS
eukprot:gene12935-15291_t